jgi:putative chitinase
MLLIQITGRANYRDRGAALKIDLIASPNLAADPVTAVLIALSYWKSRGCNEAADEDDVEKVTRLINGGTHGLIDRQKMTDRAKRIFVEEPLIA